MKNTPEWLALQQAYRVCLGHEAAVIDYKSFYVYTQRIYKGE